ncbi:MAG: hypothetical protein M1823_003491 [Watsoniomyces obsoletus]|nr:MAG: hypothetical protein M1823_003491 [Watsoniomyces obsoletus]
MQPERKTKPIFRVDTPYSTVEWPPISPDHQEKILDMLCSLLAPIGDHRRNFIIPSKGERAKRKEKKIAKASNDGAVAMDTRPEETSLKAPSPALLSDLTIGFNETTRHLENLSFRSSPATQTPLAGKILPHPRLKRATAGPQEKDDEATQKATTNDDAAAVSLRHVSAIFVPRSDQPSVLHSHLPLLAHTASMARPSLPPIRLVALPKGCESRLQEALALPRVNFLGLLDGAAEASQLIELVREHVPIVDVPWLAHVKQANFLPLQVEITQCLVPTMNKAQKRKMQAEGRSGPAKEEEVPKRGKKDRSDLA